MFNMKINMWTKEVLELVTQFWRIGFVKNKECIVEKVVENEGIEVTVLAHVAS